MDEDLSQVVVETFVRLYEQGLIYRGKRLVNWDPKLQTAVADLEVETEEEDGRIWEIRYPAVEGNESITVATTRPETMLGDVAVAVHPSDERYRHLVGKSLALPLTDRTIPVIADDYVDKEFGTGAVKITPAHDFNDFALGQRHRLEPISIFTLTQRSTTTRRRNIAEWIATCARKAVLADLRAAGLVVIRKATQDDGTALRAHRRNDRADAVGAVVHGDEQAGTRGNASSGASRLRRWRSTSSRAARSTFFPEHGKRFTTSGSKTSRTGASRANCGGAIRFRRGTTSKARCSSRAAKQMHSHRPARAHG